MKKIVLGGFAFVGGAVMYSIGTLGFAHHFQIRQRLSFLPLV